MSHPHSTPIHSKDIGEWSYLSVVCAGKMAVLVFACLNIRSLLEDLRIWGYHVILIMLSFKYNKTRLLCISLKVYNKKRKTINKNFLTACVRI